MPELIKIMQSTYHSRSISNSSNSSSCLQTPNFQKKFSRLDVLLSLSKFAEVHRKPCLQIPPFFPSSKVISHNLKLKKRGLEGFTFSKWMHGVLGSSCHDAYFWFLPMPRITPLRVTQKKFLGGGGYTLSATELIWSSRSWHSHSVGL